MRKTYKSKTKTNRTSKYSKTTRQTTSATYSCNSPRFTSARNECQWRIGSYRNVYSQFTPTGTKTVFSPTAATKWTKYINNGNFVYKYTNTQFAKYFGQKWTTSSPTTVRQYLRKKFGPGIKDVSKGKGNCWLVATTKNVTGRPFTNYSWK